LATPPWEITRSLLAKASEETDPKYGCTPENRSFRNHLRYGVINLDKPPGPTSHEVVAWVKRIMNIERAGHGGTLEI
jgi:H/ACA ribonucleoprotein complex subunit 4